MLVKYECLLHTGNSQTRSFFQSQYVCKNVNGFLPNRHQCRCLLFGLLTETDFVMSHRGLTEHDVAILAFRMKKVLSILMFS